MSFAQKRRDDVVLFTINGQLMGGSEIRKISEQLNRLLKQGHTKIVLDMKRVNRINSLGIGVLIKWLHILRDQGGDLRFTNTGYKVHQYFQITKLLTVFEISTSLYLARNYTQLKAFRLSRLSR